MNFPSILTAAFAAALLCGDWDGLGAAERDAFDHETCAVATADGSSAVNPVALWSACRETLKRKDELNADLIELQQALEEALDNGDTDQISEISAQIKETEDELTSLAPYVKLCKNLITRLHSGSAL